MSKATEEALAELHGAVATALTTIMAGTVMEGGGTAAPSAAHIMASITFLKNNNITADATSNAALAGLADALAKRKNAKGRLSKSVLDDVAEQLDRELGGMMQ